MLRPLTPRCDGATVPMAVAFLRRGTDAVDAVAVRVSSDRCAVTASSSGDAPGGADVFPASVATDLADPSVAAVDASPSPAQDVAAVAAVIVGSDGAASLAVSIVKAGEGGGVKSAARTALAFPLKCGDDAAPAWPVLVSVRIAVPTASSAVPASSTTAAAADAKTSPAQAMAASEPTVFVATSAWMGVVHVLRLPLASLISGDVPSGTAAQAHPLKLRGPNMGPETVVRTLSWLGTFDFTGSMPLIAVNVAAPPVPRDVPMHHLHFARVAPKSGVVEGPWALECVASAGGLPAFPIAVAQSSPGCDQQLFALVLKSDRAVILSEGDTVGALSFGSVARGGHPVVAMSVADASAATTQSSFLFLIGFSSGALACLRATHRAAPARSARTRGAGGGATYFAMSAAEVAFSGKRDAAAVPQWIAAAVAHVPDVTRGTSDGPRDRLTFALLNRNTGRCEVFDVNEGLGGAAADDQSRVVANMRQNRPTEGNTVGGGVHGVSMNQRAGMLVGVSAATHLPTCLTTSPGVLVTYDSPALTVTDDSSAGGSAADTHAEDEHTILVPVANTTKIVVARNTGGRQADGSVLHASTVSHSVVDGRSADVNELCIVAPSSRDRVAATVDAVLAGAPRPYRLVAAAVVASKLFVVTDRGVGACAVSGGSATWFFALDGSTASSVPLPRGSLTCATATRDSVLVVAVNKAVTVTPAASVIEWNEVAAGDDEAGSVVAVAAEPDEDAFAWAALSSTNLSLTVTVLCRGAVVARATVEPAVGAAPPQYDPGTALSFYANEKELLLAVVGVSGESAVVIRVEGRGLKDSTPQVSRVTLPHAHMARSSGQSAPVAGPVTAWLPEPRLSERPAAALLVVKGFVMRSHRGVGVPAAPSWALEGAVDEECAEGVAHPPCGLVTGAADTAAWTRLGDDARTVLWTAAAADGKPLPLAVVRRARFASVAPFGGKSKANARVPRWREPTWPTATGAGPPAGEGGLRLLGQSKSCSLIADEAGVHGIDHSCGTDQWVPWSQLRATQAAAFTPFVPAEVTPLGVEVIAELSHGGGSREGHFLVACLDGTAATVLFTVAVVVAEAIPDANPPLPPSVTVVLTGAVNCGHCGAPALSVVELSGGASSEEAQPVVVRGIIACHGSRLQTATLRLVKSGSGPSSDYPVANAWVPMWDGIGAPQTHQRGPHGVEAPVFRTVVDLAPHVYDQDSASQQPANGDDIGAASSDLLITASAIAVVRDQAASVAAGTTSFAVVIGLARGGIAVATGVMPLLPQPEGSKTSVAPATARLHCLHRDLPPFASVAAAFRDSSSLRICGVDLFGGCWSVTVPGCAMASVSCKSGTCTVEALQDANPLWGPWEPGLGAVLLCRGGGGGSFVVCAPSSGAAWLVDIDHP